MPFPLRRLARAGVNICLGTDSLATVYKTRRQTVELNLFEEMRALAHEAQPRCRPGELSAWPRSTARVRWACAARSANWPKAFADLIALPFAGKLADIYDAVLHHAGDVAASMIDGDWAIAPWTPDEAIIRP